MVRIADSGAVQYPIITETGGQTLAQVVQGKMMSRAGGLLRRQRVVHLQAECALLESGVDRKCAGLPELRDAVVDGVLHQRLQTQ